MGRVKEERMRIRYINEEIYCCDDMEKLLNKDDFTYYDKENRSKTFNILMFKGYVRNSNIDYIKIPIRYCPFCGEKVEFAKEVKNEI